MVALNYTGLLGSEWTSTVTLEGGLQNSNFTGNALATGADDVTIGVGGGRSVTISNSSYQNFPTVPVGARNILVLGGSSLAANDSRMTIADTLAVDGTFNLNSDTVTILGRIVNNSPTFNVNAQGGGNAASNLLLGNITLTGTGNLRLNGNGGSTSTSDHSAQLLGAFVDNIATLTNESRISGKGTIGFNGFHGNPGGALVLHNTANGVVDANVAGSAISIINSTLSAANPTLNAGTLQATLGGTLRIDTAAVEQDDGRIIADGAGSTVTLRSTQIKGGFLQTSNGGVIQVENHSTVLDGSTLSGALHNYGTFRVGSNEQATLKGAIDNSAANNGVIELNGYQTVLRIDASGATLSGGGRVQLTYNEGEYRSATIAAASGQSSALTNVDNTIAGAGFIHSRGVFETVGQLRVYNQAAGTIEATDPLAPLVLQDLAAFVNDGSVRANGGTLELRTAMTGSGSLSITNGGTLMIAGTINRDIAFIGAGAETLRSTVYWTEGYTGTLTGFGVGDRVDLNAVPGFSIANPDTFRFVQNGANGRLVFEQGGSERSIAIAGVQGSELTLTADGHGVALTRVAATLGDSGDNHLTGTAGNDRLLGLEGADILTGGAGDDVLDGGSGFDYADYSQAAGGVVVRTVAGFDSTRQNVGGGEGADLLRSIEGLIGSAFDDVLVGDDGFNILIGGAGNDTLYGGDGVDTLYGGDGDDYIQGDGGDFSTLVGGAGNDQIYGGAGNDYIVGDAGDDVLVGLGGQDSLYGGAGNDYIVAGDGVGSVVDGGAGANILWGAGGNDYMVGGELADLIVGGGGSDYVFGNAGDDTIYGGQGMDYIYTNAGADFVWTDDVGAPQSTDYIYVGGGTGVDTIADFAPGSGENHDVLVVALVSGVSTFTQLMANTTQIGVYTVITLGADQVYLYNVQPFQLTEANTLFL